MVHCRGCSERNNRKIFEFQEALGKTNPGGFFFPGLFFQAHVSAMEKALQRNIFKIYAMGCCHAFQLITPVFVPLLLGHGLSMSEILQTQAVFALVLAAFEVPSGYFADRVGRRTALICGSLIAVAGYAMLTQADSFVDFVIFECLMGVAYSLFSGTDMALLFDSQMALAKLRAKPASQVTVGRLVAIAGIAEAGAAILASLLLSGVMLAGMDEAGRFSVLLSVQLACTLPPLLLTWRMIEAPRATSNSQVEASPIRQVVHVLLFDNPVVLRIAAATLTYGLLALFVFWLYQPFWAQQGVPVAWFGYIWAAFCATRSLSAQWATALEQRFGSDAMLLLMFLLPATGLLLMLLLDGWAAVAALLLFPLSRGISSVLFYDGLNRRVEADYRATINSLVSLGTRAVFIVCGPLLGYLVDAYSLQTAIQLLLLLFTPLLLLQLLNLQRFLRKDRRRAARSAAAG
jgi:MFS family permease